MNWARATGRFWSEVAACVPEMRAWRAGFNREAFEAAPEVPELVVRLDTLLHAVDDRLGVVLGGTCEELELIITAHGRREAFGAVINLVGSAPDIDGLFIRAFRPRMPAEVLDRYRLATDSGGIGFSEVSCAVRPSDSPGRVDLLVRVPDYLDVLDAVHPHNVAVAERTLLMLDAVLGEYDTETRVGALVCTAANFEPSLPLSSLVAVVDQIAPADVG